MRKLCTFLAALTLVVLCFVLLPDEAKAAEMVAQGTCGDNLIWTLDAEGVLTISGTGEMWDYCDSWCNANYLPENVPWCQVGMPIESVIIDKGVTSIGRGAFVGCDLEYIYIPGSVQKIGAFAFLSCTDLSTVYICDETAWENTDFEVGSLVIPELGMEGVFPDLSSNPTFDGYGLLPDADAELNYHYWIGGDCVNQSTCVYCGTLGGSTNHVWIDATCTSAKFCFVCGKTEGSFGHSWVDATCVTAKICSVCGQTDGTAPGHSWKSASCTTPKTCTVCGATEGEKADHNWLIATCTQPKTCLSCGLTEGSVQHSWVAANCTSPKTCASCGKTEGENKHQWVDATCTKPMHCTVCKTTIGNPVHTYDNASDIICNVCGNQRVLTDSALKFYGNPGLSFQDYIGMQLLVQNNVLSSYDKVYVIAVQGTPDGDVETVLSGNPYFGAYQIFEQPVVSWSMTEMVTLTLYAEKNGNVYQGQTISASVAELAMNKLATYKAQNNSKACTALVDMLNYGAAVQSFFGRNTTNLPNANLGDFAAFGSTNEPVLSADNAISGTAKVSVLTDNISLQDKVELQLLFNADISAYTPKATVNGIEAKVIVDTQAYASYGWTVVRVAVEAAKVRDTYTLALYNADGNAVTQVYEISVEGYANSRKDTDKHALDVALMRYGDSVAAL